MEERILKINLDETVPFRNHVDECIGTGRMGLALQKEYQEQLRYVQGMIGFRHIRGHGLFCDDMAIYQEYEENGMRKAEYNFTYLDRVMDSYRAMGLRPFLELGFMPEKLSSGQQTVFYWKGNVTPPKSGKAWCALVQATLRHLCGRYGVEETVQWPVEVWNEPNLPGFWKDADMEAYFELFEETFWAVKKVDPRFRVGGPAICGVEDEQWIREFLEFCRKRKIPVDFITRHHYTTEMPEYTGHYGYAKLHNPEENKETLKMTRRIVDQFPEFIGKEIHITEFNTSYIPNCPLHDTNRNAAYIAGMLSWLGDMNESYSYWTFGDVFEENGVPFTPFHGGFGLVANGCIPKPTFWTFYFYKQLKGECICRTGDTVVTREKDGSYRAICWNLCMEGEERERKITLEFPAKGEQKEWCIVEQLVDERVCNPLKIWHDLGEPSDLSEHQQKLLQECAKPLITTYRSDVKNEKFCCSVELSKNAVVFLEIHPVIAHSDRGYFYEWIAK
ncbi:MAG: glycosyl hydrolase [Fusicatenibacter sp.]